jgi:hypothetical protein
MSQKDLTTAISGELQLIKNLIFGGIGDLSAIEICPLAILISLKFLQAPLIIAPLVCKKLPAIHTANRYNHVST